jgi:phage/plasmid-associated DNA primase
MTPVTQAPEKIKPSTREDQAEGDTKNNSKSMILQNEPITKSKDVVSLTSNHKDTIAYIQALTGDADTKLTFAAYHDKDKQKQPRHFFDKFANVAEDLERLNKEGYGIFVVVQETFSVKRKTEDIGRVRVLFIDLDKPGDQPEYHLEPSIVVESSPNKYHVYWKLEQPEHIDAPDFKQPQKQLIAHYGSDPGIHDLTRVMRLPGFLHQKGEPFLTRIVTQSDARYTKEEIVKRFTNDTKPQLKPQITKQAEDVKRFTDPETTSNADNDALSDEPNPDEKTVYRCNKIIADIMSLKNGRRIAVNDGMLEIGGLLAKYPLLREEYFNDLTKKIRQSGWDDPEERIKNARKSLEEGVKKPLDHSPSPSVSTKSNEDPNEVTTTVEDTVLKGLFEDGKGSFIVMNQAYYHYNDKGAFKHIEDECVEKWIAQSLRKLWTWKKIGSKESIEDYKFATESNKKNCFKFCRSILTLDRPVKNDHLLVFNNGTVDLRTGEIQPHSRDNFLTFQIEADYKKGSDCPKIFKEFVEDSYGLETLELLRACISMTLDPTAPYGYVPHLIGRSGGGKGTLLTLVKSLFGEDYVRSLGAFSQLSSPEQLHQNLTGSRLVVFPDLGGFQSGLRNFYELVDNGSMSGRALFSSNSYNKAWNCRFWLASVDHLQIENSGDGWHRRVIPIPLKNRQSKTDKYLGEKLAKCKPELISWALAMPREERDYMIMNASKLNPQIAALKKEQDIYSDSIKAFIDQCLVPSENTEKVSSHQLYAWYVCYCRVSGFSPVNESKFTSHAKNTLPENRKARTTARVKGEGALEKIPACWINLKQVHHLLFNADNVTCNKEYCGEGGLEEFKKFWNQQPDLDKEAETEDQIQLATLKPNLELSKKGLIENALISVCLNKESGLIYESEIKIAETTVDDELISCSAIVLTEQPKEIIEICKKFSSLDKANIRGKGVDEIVVKDSGKNNLTVERISLKD